MSFDVVELLRGQKNLDGQPNDLCSQAANLIELLATEAANLRTALAESERQRESLQREVEFRKAELVGALAGADAFKEQLYEEINANLAFREAGGALPDEDMPTFCARLLAEREEMSNRLGEQEEAELRSRALAAEKDAAVRHAIQAAASNLPHGYQLDICVEKYAGWIRLCNPNGEPVQLPDAADKSLAEQITEAIDAAREQGERHEQ